MNMEFYTNNMNMMGEVGMQGVFRKGFIQDIGNGVCNTFDIEHNLGTMNVHVFIRENNSPYSDIQADVIRHSEDCVTIQFSVVPKTNEYKVTVLSLDGESDGDFKRERFENIIYESKEAAVETLTFLRLLIKKHGYVSIADYYDVLGKLSCFTDNKYGWISLDRAFVTKSVSGHIINFPTPIDLNYNRGQSKTECDAKTSGDNVPIVLTISRVDLLSKQFIQEEYIEQIGQVACVCGVYKTIRSVKVTEQEVIVELS